MSDESADDRAAGYAACLDAMQDAARRWAAAHPFAELRFAPFEHELMREQGVAVAADERVAVVAVLSDVIDRWAANADARSFLQALVEASNGEATYMQARALVDQATAHQLERASGQLPGGDWRCTGCTRVNDGFTNVDGNTEIPGPGALNVCAYCATIQRVNSAGAGFEPVSETEINRLPKSLRVQLRGLQNHIRARIAREKARS